ncbi:MAG: hypothetical protein AVDCRST_MAG33-2814, partial [uncultured Thermomicrobiales bacterium]
ERIPARPARAAPADVQRRARLRPGSDRATGHDPTQAAPGDRPNSGQRPGSPRVRQPGTPPRPVHPDDAACARRRAGPVDTSRCPPGRESVGQEQL